MKKTFYFFILTFLFLSISAQSQDNPIQLRFYGYLNHQVLYDTYRSVDSRDGEFYLFPKKPVFDINGNDINKRSKFNMVEVQSRFGVNVQGPDAFGAKTMGKFEADFFGTHQNNVRLLRLRLAVINLKWQTTELMFGNAFHPTFVLDCFPNTVSFAAAVPFHPLNRSPQIRLKQFLTPGVSASLSFLTHGYHSSAGPVDAQRNSGLPDTQLQLRFGEIGNVLFGVTAGYKYLSPRDITLDLLATSKNVGSYNLQAFTKIIASPITIKLQGNFGENLSHFFMIGGYGIKGTPETVDLNGDYDYANLRTISAWSDIHYNRKSFEIGLFTGYTENLGSKDNYIPVADLSRYDDLHYLFRVSPRIYYIHNNLSFGFEYAFYSAVYASEFNLNRKPISSMDPAINNHIIFQTRYVF
jgi:hypothetical protein